MIIIKKFNIGSVLFGSNLIKSKKEEKARFLFSMQMVGKKEKERRSS